MSFTGKTHSFLNVTLSNDGFFPDLSLGDFQRVYRIPAEYHADMVKEHLRLAMVAINVSLAERKDEWISGGFESLAAVSDQELDGQKLLVMHYQQAVYCRAKASLLQAFATMNRRESAENLAKEAPETEQKYLSLSVRAVRRLLGQATGITAVLL
ncbi:head completion/stabilization protein [Hahella ganghwensis]|uniref:head completion/stabilization protein n=1 Tax=Hahella ganghwensis TaxID=286420 RepID=UPI000375D703|nr:head completion/stabilization protein [Hahella ganghwensis]